MTRSQASSDSIESVAYWTADSPLGRLLVAATDRGVFYANAGVKDKALVDRLEMEYPGVRFVKNAKAGRMLDAVNRHIAGQTVDLPLDLRGTEFQLTVWAALQRIPPGQTRTYSEVAQMIGRPKAVRAVAHACATNPIPFVVPCHRVIRKDGSLGGYGGGLPMKTALLSDERVRAGRNQETARAYRQAAAEPSN